MLLARQDQVLAHRQLREHLQQLKGPAHTQPIEVARAHAGHGAAVQMHIAAAWLQLAEDAVEQGRFAAAVGADDAEDLALADIEGYAGDGDDAAEALLQVAHLEDGVHRTVSVDKAPVAACSRPTAAALVAGVNRRSARPSKPAGQNTISTMTRAA